MRYLRYALCGAVALIVGFAVGAAFGNAVIGFAVVLLVSLVGTYLLWESGSRGQEASQLTAEEEPGDERYAGGYAGFHDGGGGLG